MKQYGVETRVGNTQRWGCIGDITGKNRTLPRRIASAVLELCPERHRDNVSKNIDGTSLCCAESQKDFSVPFMFSSMD